nr:MAG TPA: hypothetical protein [Caudoviricetes sp.]
MFLIFNKYNYKQIINKIHAQNQRMKSLKTHEIKCQRSQ